MVKFLKTIWYKLKKSKFVKELMKVDNPEDYINKYNLFKEHYSKYKEGKYEPNKIEEMLGNYLKSKGLKRIEEVLKELDIKQKIIEDSNIINKLTERITKLELNINELQDLVLATLQDNKNLKEKFKTLNLLNFKKTMKPKGRFNVK